MFHKELTSSVEIKASAERVWEILTDFSTYQEWNPFIRPVVGRATEGTRLKVQIWPVGGRPVAFSPRVVKVEKDRELRWLGRLWLPGLFDGQHIFTIHSLDQERVRFIQKEIFSGLLVPLMAKRLDQQTLPGFEKMNEALKERAEAEDRNNAGKARSG